MEKRKFAIALAMGFGFENKRKKKNNGNFFEMNTCVGTTNSHFHKDGKINPIFHLSYLVSTVWSKLK